MFKYDPTDPVNKAEKALFEFTEAIVELHGQFKGRHKLYVRLLEWLADKLIYRGLE